MALPKIIADFTTQLTAALAIGGAASTLYSNVDDDGVALPTGLYYFTLDGTNSNKEFISCTNTAGALTAIKSVSRQGVEVSGVARAHAVGCSVVMTDFNAYKVYIDNLAISGASDASLTVKGVTKLSVAPVSDPIAVGSNDIRVPTADPATLFAPISTVASPSGTISPYAGRTAPTGFLFCDGTAVSRATYASLLAVIAPSQTFTVTIASPGVFTATAHGLVAGDKLHFTTTGGLAAGLSVNTDYYVIASGLTSSNFEVSATRGGSAVNTSGSQSGIHTFYISNYGKGDGSTTFNIPDMRGYTPYGYLSSDANFNVLNVPNTYAGEKNHQLITAELASHSHIVNYYSGNSSSTQPIANTNTDFGIVLSRATGTAGSDTPHNNLPPYVVVNFIIKI
jgi:microcystin-dependent protein